MAAIRRFVLLAALVATGVVAGCGSDDVAEPSPTGERGARATAEEVAAEWEPGAELVSVAGGEGDLASLVNASPLSWLPAYVDGAEGERGDGRSPTWAYEYQAGERGLGVLVDADGSLVDSLEIDVTPQPGLLEETVDSTRAVEAAAGVHPVWQGLPDDTGVAYALYHDETLDGPVWALGHLTEAGERSVTLVDAATGEALGASEDGRDPITPRGRAIGPQTPPRAAGTFDGHVDSRGAEQSWAVFLQNPGHPTLALRLVVDEPVTGSVNATLTSGGRALVQLEAGPRDTNATAEWPLPDAGEYEVTVELDIGVDQAYTLHWCAPGTGGGAEPTPACQAWVSGKR